MSVPDSIQEAQDIISTNTTDFSRLDQIADLQRLMGPVISYKVLLEIVINSSDDKERRLAASHLLAASKEPPDKIAERLRKSIFHDLSLEQLEAIVQTGITDPAEAIKKFKRG